MRRGNVLPLDEPELPVLDAPRQKAFREAVAKTIRDIKSAHGLTNVELAEEIGCCADTISNGENKHNDMNAVTLLRIAFRFGEAAINPVRGLYLRNVPHLSADSHRIAIAAHTDALARMVGA